MFMHHMDEFCLTVEGHQLTRSKTRDKFLHKSLNLEYSSESVVYVKGKSFKIIPS